jgi:hypothetical protein
MKDQEVESVESSIKCREIVQTVLDYGVNQKEIYQLIYLLSLELENIEHMKKITNFISETKKSKIIGG